MDHHRHDKFEESFVIISPDDEADDESRHHEPGTSSSPSTGSPHHSDKKLKPKMFKYKKLFSFKRKPIEKRLRTQEEIEQQLNQLKVERKVEDLIMLYSCEYAQLYLIHSDGHVELMYETAALQVIRFNETKTFFLSFCLKVMDRMRYLEWIYPLDKDNLHCLFTNYGAFILPELPVQRAQHGGREGVTYGLVFPKPSAEIVLDILEGVLSVSAEDKEVTSPNQRSCRKSRYISAGFIVGAEKASELIGQAADSLKTRIEPPTRSPSPIVSDKLKSRLETSRNVSDVAYNLTGRCSIVAENASMALGRYLTPQIQNHLSPLLSKSLGISPETPPEKNSFDSNLVSGMERSTSMIRRNVSTNVSHLMDQKYGENSGSAAESTFYTVGNVMNISKNLKSQSPKGLLKRTARSTSIAIVRDYKTNMHDSEVDKK